MAAKQLTEHLKLPLVESLTAGVPISDYEILVVVTPQRLELRWATGGKRPIWVDASRLDAQSHAGGRLNQPLASAVGIKRYSKSSKQGLKEEQLNVIDVTAGLGQDSWLLASLGCHVIALERSPIVAALLRDGLARAQQTHPAVAARINLVETDARLWLARQADEHRPDVVYLDPMFPPRSKTAAPKKEMRLLRRLVGDDPDVAQLARQALATARRRVVVKRSLHAELLLENRSFVKKGKAVRYDVYVKP